MLAEKELGSKVEHRSSFWNWMDCQFSCILLLAFYRYSEKIKVILVLPEDDLKTWHLLCSQYKFKEQLILQRGGETRFQSVKNGLQKIEDDGLVAIHDGVRPLVSEDIIATSFRLAAIHNPLLRQSIERID